MPGRLLTVPLGCADPVVAPPPDAGAEGNDVGPPLDPVPPLDARAAAEIESDNEDRKQLTD